MTILLAMVLCLHNHHALIMDLQWITISIKQIRKTRLVRVRLKHRAYPWDEEKRQDFHGHLSLAGHPTVELKTSP